MNPVGSQLDHGTQNKFAQVHAWVRDCEVVSVDNEIIDSYDVDVDKAVAIRAVGIAMRAASQLAFDILCYGKHFVR